MVQLILIALIIFIAVYGGLNYYIGLRGWQALGTMIPFLNSKVYWILFWAIALSYILARLLSSTLPGPVSNALGLLGSYWMAAFFYLILILGAIDLVRLLDRLMGFLPRGLKGAPFFVHILGIMVFLAVTSVIVYGAINSRNPKVVHYDISIPKSGGSVEELHAVMVSDMHLGTIINNGRLTKMVDMINGLKPDIVLFAGDVIDESVEPFIEQKMADSLSLLKTKYGAYSVLGNHEYIGEHGDEAVKYLEKAGILVLRDSYVRVADSFYVAGRDDSSGKRYTGHERKKLPELMEGMDSAMPVILLDHQPVKLDEAEKSGVDLQLSGHTHKGQLFPNQIITSIVYEVDWGYLKKQGLQVIVSSGFGTWGPPVRTGSSSEIVDITIHLTGK
jgi:predicted MPP superfamily phosphohydrolase